MRFKRRQKLPKPEKCEHLLTMPIDPRPEGGCPQCLALGDSWVHLRFCVECRAIGCCEASKNQHARKHAESTSHPVVRTLEPGEDWAWCYSHAMGRNLPPADTATH
jgi:uncharacterized UBP type Zn finger protein